MNNAAVKSGLWALLLLGIGLAGITFYKLTYYGPVSLTIKTNDGSINDDFYTVYGAAADKMEGSKILYRESVLASNESEIRINEKIKAFFPSYFFVTVCHPLYMCAPKHIRRQAVSGEIAFGEVVLTSWRSIIEGINNNPASRVSFFEKMLIEITHNYVPHTKRMNHKVNARYYAEQINGICAIAYEDKPELTAQKCGVSRFEDMLKNVE